MYLWMKLYEIFLPNHMNSPLTSIDLLGHVLSPDFFRLLLSTEMAPDGAVTWLIF